MWMSVSYAIFTGIFFLVEISPYFIHRHFHSQSRETKTKGNRYEHWLITSASFELERIPFDLVSLHSIPL